MIGKGGRSSLPNILEILYRLGRFPMALPDQLATQAVLLADERHPEGTSSIPEHSVPTRRRGAITTIPLGARSTACQVWKQLEPTTSNEDIETDGKTKHEHNDRTCAEFEKR